MFKGECGCLTYGDIGSSFLTTLTAIGELFVGKTPRTITFLFRFDTFELVHLGNCGSMLRGGMPRAPRIWGVFRPSRSYSLLVRASPVLWFRLPKVGLGL